MSREYIRSCSDIALGAALIALGGVVGLQAATLPAGTNFFSSSQFFPYLIACGLALVGIGILRGSPSNEGQDGAQGFDLLAPALIVAGLVAEFFLLDMFGWIPAAAVLFVAVSRAFGERRLWLDIVIGIALTGALYLGFDKGLGLELPLGSLIDNFFQAE